MQITAGVFQIVREIPEIGARVGDRLVLRPHAERPAIIQRTVDPTWAFSCCAELAFTHPPLPTDVALRILRDRVPCPRPHRHLRVLR